ncbi:MULTISPECIES: hypothetical protein [Anaerofustis]|uniref:hypothetical protein n=1 Tax=Anaerofustis TaxID=264995 RepID=UPI001484CA52|nr:MULTISPECIES: hypothetical protein [Anaerofustis]MCO8194413.1 hypothetical protein [Anaerofustis sp. NSJ-163]
MKVIELNDDDILILKATDVMSYEAISGFNNKFKECNLKIILIPNHIEIIGIKHT